MIKKIRVFLGGMVREKARCLDNEQMRQSGKYNIRWACYQWLSREIRDLACWVSGHKWEYGNFGKCTFKCGWHQGFDRKIYHQ